MKEEHVSIGPDDVIIIRDQELASGPEIEYVVAGLHERYPRNLVILLSGESTFETTPITQLQALLEDLIAHQEAAVSQDPEKGEG